MFYWLYWLHWLYWLFFALGHIFRGGCPPRAAPECGFAAPGPLTRPGLSALAAEAKAERVANGEVCRLGWKEEDLEARRKSDPANSAIARRLRTGTDFPIKAITSAVDPGRARSANARVGQAAASDPNQGRLRR